MAKNHLDQEKSPYLLQHKDNPVHWYAWGEEAFQAAKAQDKPIFLSVGYSTCHWCHVMAHESFEDPEVANYLNEHFISIKVDREERPDVDEIYMAGVHAMGQRGGWPLSMFLTTDLKPFYGGTYWPKANFLSLLSQLTRLWKEERAKAEDSSEGLIQHLKEQKAAVVAPTMLSPEVFSAFYRNSLVNFDRKWGGFGGAPKFPHTMQLAMLLRIYRRTGDGEALQMVVHTLDKMARGGIYDHLGSGFARYSVDAQWMIPHFEKMLYDNALLAPVYFEATQVTGIEMYEQVGREILDYTLRMMAHPEGGFYSAEDADSEGVEGKFYVWDFQELEAALSLDEFVAVQKVYGAKPSGNFEGKNNFYLETEYGWDAKEEPALKSAREKLFKIREARIHPHLDDKVLTAWNGLMIRAMAVGYQVTGDEKYLQAAHRACQFLKMNLIKDGKLLARWRDGEGRFAARQEDYSFLILGLIDLYQCDFKRSVLEWAEQLQEIQDKTFWDESEGGYFYTDGRDKSLLVRSKEGMDGALPNGNAVSAWNLLRLEGLLGKPELRARAQKIFSVFSRMFQEYPHAFSQMVLAYDYSDDDSKELAIISKGEDSATAQWLRKFHEGYQPNMVWARGEEGASYPSLLSQRTGVDSGPNFYLCENHACQAPSVDGEQIFSDLKISKKYKLS